MGQTQSGLIGQIVEQPAITDDRRPCEEPSAPRRPPLLSHLFVQQWYDLPHVLSYLLADVHDLRIHKIGKVERGHLTDLPAWDRQHTNRERFLQLPA